MANLALCLAGGEQITALKPEFADRYRRLMEEAIRRQKQALELEPRSQEYRRRLGNHYGNFALLLTELKAPDAEQAHRQAVDYKKQLVADYPNVAMYRGDLGASLHNFASLLDDLGKLEESRQMLEQAVENQRAALQANPRSRCLPHVSPQSLPESDLALQENAAIRRGRESFPCEALPRLRNS